MEKDPCRLDSTSPRRNSISRVSPIVICGNVDPSISRGDGIKHQEMKIDPTAGIAGIAGINDFSVGNIVMDNSRTPLSPSSPNESSYIPVHIARNHIGSVVEDMHKMKSDCKEAITKISEHYEKIEQATKKHYENYIADLKAKTLERLRYQKQIYLECRSEADKYKKEAEEIAQSLEITCHTHIHEKKKILDKYFSEKLASEKAKEDKEVKLIDAHQIEMSRVCQSFQLQLEEAQMIHEDKAKELLRLSQMVQDLEKKRVRDIQFHLEEFKANQHVEGEVLAVLLSMMEHLELEAQIMEHEEREVMERALHELMDKVKEQKERENSLRRQISERTLLLKQDGTEDRKQDQQQDRNQHEGSNQHEGLKKHEGLKGSIQKPCVVQDFTMDSNNRQMENILPIHGHQGTINDHSSNHSVDYHSVDNDDKRKQQLECMKNEYSALQIERKEYKRKIKHWVKQFEEKEGRSPATNDKAVIKEWYIAFKQLDEKLEVFQKRIQQMDSQLVCQIDSISDENEDSTKKIKNVDEKVQELIKDSSIHVSSPCHAVDTQPTMNHLQKMQELEQHLSETLKEKNDLAFQLQQLQNFRHSEELKMQNLRISSPNENTFQNDTEHTSTATTSTNTTQIDTNTDSRISTFENNKNHHSQEENASAADENAAADDENAAADDENAAADDENAAADDENAAANDENAAADNTDESLPTLNEEEDCTGPLSVKIPKNSIKAGMDVNTSKTHVDDDTLKGNKFKKTIVSTSLQSNLVLEEIIQKLKSVIETGKGYWAAGDKAKCHELYSKQLETLINTIKDSKNKEFLTETFQSSLKQPPAKAAILIRRAFDQVIQDYESNVQLERVDENDEGEEEETSENDTLASLSSPVADLTATSSKRVNKIKEKVVTTSSTTNSISASNDEETTTAKGGGAGGSRNIPSANHVNDLKQKIKAFESKAKSDKVKIAQLQAALDKAGQVRNDGGNDEAAKRILEKKLADLEKKNKSAMDDKDKQNNKQINILTVKLETVQKESDDLKNQIKEMVGKIEQLNLRASDASLLEKKTEVLEEKVKEAELIQQELKALKESSDILETNYKQEVALRKRYYNMIEDMKGKIRVYCRCRPMSKSEIERGNASAVTFLDEYTIQVATDRGSKQFAYDQVFSPANSQEQVFEDTKNLLQSAMDGYNVCIFAYGQTGSGKTFTMTGTPDNPGITPRVLQHLFLLKEECKMNHTVTIKAYMLELYNDQFIDLFYQLDNSSKSNAPKLETHKNAAGLVLVTNITEKPLKDADQALSLYELANKKRAVGSTNMNAESSRSHSVLSILIENYNKTTKKVCIGKLSLVDLAGSERVGKTGASAERLKEAQAINKSLSALGDVISALSTNEKFIPYRNNKLTQLMQDSLGGNAKTDESVTSLAYASRVKLITNQASKNSESEEVAKLKMIIKKLKSGEQDVNLDDI